MRRRRGNTDESQSGINSKVKLEIANLKACAPSGNARGQHGSRRDLRSLFRTESRSVNIFEPYSTRYVEKGGGGILKFSKQPKKFARAKFFSLGYGFGLVC
jgi:hypothetical protein